MDVTFKKTVYCLLFLYCLSSEPTLCLSVTQETFDV
jgi:hypothetical protein